MLTTGLCAACVFLLATSRPAHIEIVQPRSTVVMVAPSRGLSVVDVAAEVAPASLLALVGLARGERIKAVNDQVPSDARDADALIRLGARHDRYLDLSVTGGAIDRRVLLLIH